ncbi:MAG: VWA domain-containing protein [Pseudomonadota bacterium]
MKHQTSAALLIAFILPFSLFADPGEVFASTPLDTVVVMDNSETIVASDSNFHSIAMTKLLVDLLRPDDRLHLVSCGAKSSVVLSVGGDDKQKFMASIGMMKRGSSANDFVDALKALKEHYQALKKKEAEGKKEAGLPLAVWFMSSELRLNVKNEDYVVSEKAQNLWTKATRKGLPDKNLFKKKDVRDLHREMFDAAIVEAMQYAEELRNMDVPLHIFVMGGGFTAPGIPGDVLDGSIREVVKEAGARLTFLGNNSDGLLMGGIVSLFVERILAPTVTVSNEEYSAKGESFEVYRKSKNLWVAVLFKSAPPKKMTMVSIDSATGKVKKWPFGKRAEDIVFRKAEMEKGHIFKQRRWYKPPSGPAGYGLFVVRNPVEGIYRIKTDFARGEEFLIRVFQDVDLGFGFLTEPAASLPIGKDFSAVAGLNGTDGSSYTFHRSFLSALEFNVEMEKEGGGVPVWGESRQARFSKEGEVIMSFSPDSPGIYYVKGRIDHKSGEFETALKPFKVEVFRKVKIEFIEEDLTWSEPVREGWFMLTPGLRLKPGIEIPEDLQFDLRMDWSKVSNVEKIEIMPARAVKVVHGRKDYVFMIRYVDPSSDRFSGESFEGPVYLTVGEEQKKNVDGSGSWVVNVKGMAAPWTPAMYWNEYFFWISILLILLLGLVLFVERLLRPSFKKDLTLSVSRKNAGAMDTLVTLNTRDVRKPLLPFRRQKIFIGVDGRVNVGRGQKACRIEAGGKPFFICPMKAPVRFRQGDMDYTAQTRFPGKIDERYHVGAGEAEIEFWIAARRGRNEKTMVIHRSVIFAD